MSKESKALMKAFHSLIDDDADKLVHSLESRGDPTNLAALTDREARVLSTISLTKEELSVIRKLARSTGRLTVFGILSIIDGVSYAVDESVPDLALVNRETKGTLQTSFGMMNSLNNKKINYLTVRLVCQIRSISLF